MKNLIYARHKHENLYLFSSIILIFSLLYFFYDLNPIVTFIGIILGLFYIRLVQGQFLGNALQISEKHFYRTKQIVEDKSKNLGIQKPKVFIYQDPNPEAFTLGFTNPYSVILSSSLIENLSEDELEAVIAHELGHIKFNHSRITSLVNPANKNIFILSWIFSFWQRAAELTADNISLLTTENPRALITALIKIGIGPKFLEQIDEEELLSQSIEIQKSNLNKWGELLNSHPYLTTRVNNILSLSKTLGFIYLKGGKIYCVNCGDKISVSAKFCPKCGFGFNRIT